jgi:hypothetical protein
LTQSRTTSILGEKELIYMGGISLLLLILLIVIILVLIF